jgi:hypothetical protein
MRLHPPTGTIDHPTAADPQKQAPMNPSVLDTPARTHGAATRRQNRTREMQLIPEALARAHVQQRLYEAEAERPARRLIRADRLQRRAERASLRARRALAAMVIR